MLLWLYINEYAAEIGNNVRHPRRPGFASIYSRGAEAARRVFPELVSASAAYSE